MAGRCASPNLEEAFVAAARGDLDRPPSDPRNEEVDKLKQMHAEQVLCSPPGALGGQFGVFAPLLQVRTLRKLSPLEAASVTFRVDRFRGKIGAGDPRLGVNAEILELCEGVCIAQMNPLRILFLRANRLISALEKSELFSKKKLTPVALEAQGKLVKMRPIVLGELRRFLALFVYYVEHSLKKVDDEAFALGEVYLKFLFHQIEILESEFPSEEIKQFVRIIRCIHQCISQKGELFPLLLQPLGPAEFSKAQISMAMIHWIKLAIGEFAKNIDLFIDQLDGILPKIKKDRKKAKISQPERIVLEDKYIPGLKALREEAMSLYSGMDFIQVERLLKEVEGAPENVEGVRRLVSLLTSYNKKVQEMVSSFNDFHDKTGRAIESISKKLTTLAIDDPTDLRFSLCDYHNASVWYPFQYLSIIAGGSLIKAKLYWNEVLKKQALLERSSLFPQPTPRMNAQHILRYQVLMHDVKELVRQLYNRVSGSDQKRLVYTHFSHLVTLEEALAQVEKMRKKPGFNARYSSSIMYRRMEGLKGEIKALAGVVSGHGVRRVLTGVHKVYHSLRQALVIDEREGPTYTVFASLFLPEGAGGELTGEMIHYFQRAADLLVWTLAEWNKRPLLTIGKPPFLAHLSLEMRAHLEGYLVRIVRNTTAIRGLFYALQDIFEAREIRGREEILELADILTRAHEFVALRGVDVLYDQIMEICEGYLVAIPDPEGKVRDSFQEFRKNMRGFTDDSFTFETDLFLPSIPLIRCAHYLELLGEPAVEERVQGAAAAPQRASPLEEVDREDEVVDAGSVDLSDDAEWVAGPLALEQVETWLVRVLPTLPQEGRARTEHLGNVQEYLGRLASLQAKGRAGATMPYTFFGERAFCYALISEQLLKWMLSYDGISEEQAPLLFKHTFHELLPALERKRPQLRGVLRPSEREALIQLGHLIVDGRDLADAQTPLAARLRRLAALSLKGGSGDAEGAIARECASGEERISAVMVSLFKLLRECGVEFGEAPEISERGSLATPMPEGRLDPRLAARLDRELSAVRRLVRRVRGHGAGLEILRGAQHEVLRNRHFAMVSSLNAARYALLSLQETLPAHDALESSYALTLSIVFNGSHLLEYLLKSLVAYHDIQLPGQESGHALWTREEGRALISRHRLQRLFLLLQHHLRSQGKEPFMADLDPTVFQTLNTFGTSARYLATHPIEGDLSTRYLALKAGAEAPPDESLFIHLKILSALSRALPGSKEGFYTAEAEALCRTLFPAASSDTWAQMIGAEMASIHERALFPLMRRLFETAHQLLQLHSHLLSSR